MGKQKYLRRQMLRRCRDLFGAVIIAAVWIASATEPAIAQNFTFTGGVSNDNGVWSTATNWASGTAPAITNVGSNQELFFQSSAYPANFVTYLGAGDTSVRALTVSSDVTGNLTIQPSSANGATQRFLWLDLSSGTRVTITHNGSGTLTLGGTNGTLYMRDDTRFVTNGGDILVNRRLGGDANDDLEKNGAGTMILASTMDYQGGTIVNSGTLQLGNGAAAGFLSATPSISGSAGGTLAINRSNSLTQSIAGSTAGGGLNNKVIGGALSFAQIGTGTTILDLANTYTGTTSVSAGRLSIAAAGSISNSSAVNVAAGGNFNYNSSTALTVAPSLAGAGTGSRAVLSGTGSINAAVALDDLGDVLSPGNSPGVQPYGTSQTWNSFSYVWESNDWTGTTPGTAFDQIAIAGGLTLSASGTYQLDLISLTAGNAAGTIPNYADVDRSWTILTTTGGITGFDASKWNINTAAFTGVTGTSGRTFAVQQSGNAIELVYAVPEPTSITLAVGGVAAVAFAFARRRRAT